MSKYIFGPIPSRRLGLSLGVDLVPYKTCTLDCVYCECGVTNNLTTERKEYVPVDDVIKELDLVLQSEPELDYITFSGAGEPTLNSRIGDVINFVKKHYPQHKLCLLTNATLLGDQKLVEDLKDIDLIIPSFDAINTKEYNSVNRPEPSLKLSDFIDDLKSFRKNHPTAMWVELFIVKGHNDSPESISMFANALQEISPDKIQLNMIDRPGTEDWVEAPTDSTIKQFIEALEPIAPLNVIGSFNYTTSVSDVAVDQKHIAQRIQDMVSRRPCTIKDLSFSLCTPEDLTTKIIKELLSSNSIIEEQQSRGTFYKLAQ